MAAYNPYNVAASGQNLLETLLLSVFCMKKMNDFMAAPE